MGTMSCDEGTHHFACDCREKALADEIAKWKAEAMAARALHDHLGVCFEKWDDPRDAYEDWSTSKLWHVYYTARAAAGEDT